MSELWSKNKYINTTVNVLIFLMALNFMHAGQFFLPIICLVLFIDNKCKLKFNNIKIFILLCLFAVTFFIFSYKLGFYSAIGFTLPMAYYIGSNLYEPNEEKIKKLIYLISFGMAFHFILNLILELFLWDFDIIHISSKVTHYDFWVYLINKGWLYDLDSLKQFYVRASVTTINCVNIISCFYFLIKYEKNNKIKTIGLLLFIISFLYSISLGRRAILLLVIIVLIISLLFERLNKSIKQTNLHKYLKIIIPIIVILILFLILYFNNIFNIKNIVNNFSIVGKFFEQGLSTSRINILLKNIKLYPKYMFGGQIISGITGSVTHDLFGDIYDYAGIIPSLLMIAYFIMTTIEFYKILKNKNIENKYKLLFVDIFICNIAIILIEPVITGASLFLIIFIVLIVAINNIKSV